MRELKLGLEAKKHKGFVALVDDDIYDELVKDQWYANKVHRQKYKDVYYAARTTKLSNGKRHKEYLAHRVWLLKTGKWPKGEIDHINGNTFDNRFENLREVTNQENTWNQRPHTHRNGNKVTSDYQGVYWHKRHKKWHAQIRLDRIHIYLGYFDEEIQAAERYGQAKYHRDECRMDVDELKKWAKEQRDIDNKTKKVKKPYKSTCALN